MKNNGTAIRNHGYKISGNKAICIATTKNDITSFSISNFASEMIFDYCRAMLASTMSRNGIFKSTSLLCDLFHTILMHHTIKSDSRIISAVEYIESNYTKNIDIEYLVSAKQ